MKHLITLAMVGTALQFAGCAEKTKREAVAPVATKTVSAENWVAPKVHNIADKAIMDKSIGGMVEEGALAGAVALVYKDGKEVYFGAFGMANRETGETMKRDTLVQLYSMSKPITSVAIMQQYEQGKFKFDDPIAMHAPEFANLKVYAGKDENGKMILEEPRRPVTVADFLRHTAGLASGGDGEVAKMLAAADPGNWSNTLPEFAEKLGKVPLLYHPGDRWLYSAASDVQAFLVERLSGVPYDKYVQDNILTPLGMSETSYYVPEEKRHRMAIRYRVSDAHTSKAVGKQEGESINTKHWPMKPGGFGFVSKVDDYMTFAQMLLNGGTHNGTQILKPETIKLMATDHLPDTVGDRSWLPSKGQVGFGVNLAVRTDPPKTMDEDYGIVGEFFWDGYASTLFWVDPKTNLTAVILVQSIPIHSVKVHKRFRNAVYGVPERDAFIPAD